MKVLLFVQTGEGRPKCVKTWRTWKPSGESWVWLGASSGDRWYVVGCENAEAGRDIIAESGEGHPKWRRAHLDAAHMARRPSPNGRILASGWKP